MKPEIQHHVATIVQTLPGNCTEYAEFEDPKEGRRVAVEDRNRRIEATERLRKMCEEGKRDAVMSVVSELPGYEQVFFDSVLEPDTDDSPSTVN
ncbi:hypothetical protein KJ996_00680, partial [Patescibacteria group bacterium]|nr:hypothetical protein [Patescibacteria group bacterium]